MKMTPVLVRCLLLVAVLSCPTVVSADASNQLRGRVLQENLPPGGIGIPSETTLPVETDPPLVETAMPEETVSPETVSPETAPPVTTPPETTPPETTLPPSSLVFPLTNTTTKSKPFKNMTAIHVNATALSLGACEKVDLSIAYVTSLDLDNSFTNYSFMTSNSQKESAYVDVYILQLIITPISIGLLFFGSFLILPTCILAATALGIFAVFHVVDNIWLARAASNGAGLDCPMKLALSSIAAFLAAMMATTFVRFGLFSLGALAAGVVSYLLFDAFPIFDLGATSELDSDLSSFAWVVTIVMGCVGGILLRWYEEASLELVTATLGGIGCAYSIHTVVIIQGKSQLDRSVVFLLAIGIATLGCKCQRRRRFNRYAAYHQLKKEEEDIPLPVPAAPPLYSMPPPPPQQQPPPTAMIPMDMIPVQHHQTGPTWQQVQHSINHAVQGLAESQAQQNNNGPSSEQINELTQSLNSLVARMGPLLKAVATNEEVEDDKAD